MAPEMRVVSVTDDAGGVTDPGWLVQAEVVHRQLRPQLPEDYVSRLPGVFANGARLALDSGVQRQRAHRFYFCEGRHVSSFCFRKILK